MLTSASRTSWARTEGGKTNYVDHIWCGNKHMQRYDVWECDAWKRTVASRCRSCALITPTHPHQRNTNPRAWR